MLPRCFQSKYLILAIFGFSIVIYLCLAKSAQEFSTKTVDHLAVSLNLHTTVHVIVIDAGSTASRVNTFAFHNSVIGSQLILDDTLFYEIKPGLTFYAKNPKDVKQSLDLLLDKAKRKIPQENWSSTPIILRATAGLRLLPHNESQNILSECKRVLDTSGFKVFNDSVAIMNGSDEGIFSWFTTNFILKKFHPTYNDEDFAKMTVTALDLGGGSTQITFALTHDSFKGPSTLLAAHERNIYHVNMFGRNSSVYTNSFLGLGLMAARQEILTHPDNYKNQKYIRNNNSTEIVLHAECINPIISGVSWNYGGKDYVVKGPFNATYKIIRKNPSPGTDERKPVVRISTCLDIIKKVVKNAIPHQLPSLQEYEIYAFSYYFDRAAEAGLIDPYNGGTVTIESIYKSASEICAYPNTEQPFMCLDISFIYVLLHNGFGLDNTSKIYLKKTIDGHELSWALGAAFNVIQTES